MDAVLQKYDRAWNVADADERRRFLAECVTDDCELLEPRGQFLRREAILERINGFCERFPGARVEIVTNVDEHNGVARCGWSIADGDGAELLHGIDVVERDADGGCGGS